MGHYLINLSWKCQAHCPYCLIPHIKVNHKARQHGWEKWADGIIQNCPRGSVIDIAGGDPLLYNDLAFFLCAIADAGLRWAITTNAMSDEGVNKLVAASPANCVLVNVSDHPENQDKDYNIEKLRSAFSVKINRVDLPGDWHRRHINDLIPYQSWREGTERDGIKRSCNSGLNHWVADPSGNVFRCNPYMADGLESFGNLFDKEPMTLPEPCICVEGCSTCYTSVPGAWPVSMERV